VETLARLAGKVFAPRDQVKIERQRTNIVGIAKWADVNACLAQVLDCLLRTMEAAC
jgi:hypothetical protein